MRILLLCLIVCLWVSPVGATDWCASAAGCWLYKEGSGTQVADDSPNTNTGNFLGDGEPAWVGSVTGTNAPAYATDSVNSDGTNDYVDYGTGLDNLSPFSFVGWVELDAATNSDFIYASTGTIGGGGPQAMKMWFPSTRDLTFIILNTGSSDYVQAACVDCVDHLANSWNHIAVTWDGTTSGSHTYIYVGGTDVTNSRSSSGGTRRDDAAYYKGMSDDIDGRYTENAIFGEVLDGTDINEIMDFGLQPALVSSVCQGTCIYSATIHNATFN